MFASKAEPTQVKLNFRYSTPGLAPDLIRQHKAELERPAKDKHFRLLWEFINYDCKKFYDTRITVKLLQKKLFESGEGEK